MCQQRVNVLLSLDVILKHPGGWGPPNCLRVISSRYVVGFPGAVGEAVLAAWAKRGGMELEPDIIICLTPPGQLGDISCCR